jgi:hypothetical protein
MKLYAESKIKPTKINKTIVKLLSKQYPQLVESNFFEYKQTNTNDLIYILNFENLDLVVTQKPNVFQLSYNGNIIDGLELIEKPFLNDYNVFELTSNHWKTDELKAKRTIVALNSYVFNIQIDNAVESTEELIDKLEFRIKRLKKIDWKV